MAACRRPQRRLRRPSGQRRGRRGDPEGHEESGAARRRHPHAGRYRELAGQGLRPRHPRHRRGARSRSGQAKPASAFPGKIAVGIDARGGKVAVEGWAEASTLDVVELAQKFEGAGVAAIIYTDIDRDGVLAGINWQATHRACRRSLDPGHRLGRPRLDRRHRAHDHARRQQARRRDLRPRAL